MSISCVLCTYNGEKYIYEQLESIRKQTVPISRLIICDDNSNDTTIDIIKNWANDIDFSIDIIQNKVSLGVVKNFEKALTLADSNYIFFADQDDVWLPHKIELSIKKIKRMEAKYGKNMPCLVHSDLTVVDSALQVLNDSLLENNGIRHIYDEKKQLQYLMVQNFVTGCTIVINRALKEKSLPFPRDIIMHDYWLALVATLIGKIGFVDKATMLYRQHCNNTVGASKCYSLSNIRKMFDCNKLLKSIDNVVKQLESVRDYKCGMLISKTTDIDDFLNILYERKYWRMIFSNVRKQGMLRNMVFKYYMIIYMKKNF